MSLSKKTIGEFQEICKKKYGKEISWEEAEEGANNLIGFFDLVMEHVVEENRRKKKLEENPKGFHLEGNGYSCSICGGYASNEETWYDKWGIKCLICQNAIDKKIVPGSAAKNDESWYSKFDLENRFNIDRHVLKRFVKEGILKPRTVLNKDGKIHTQIFLIRDNKDTLPPKKFTDSHLVKEEKDGKEWFRSEPWYRFVDPYKYLEGYKIMEHLKVVKKVEK